MERKGSKKNKSKERESVFKNAVDVTDPAIVAEMQRDFHPKTAEYPYCEIAADLSATYASEALRSRSGKGLVGDYVVDPVTGIENKEKGLQCVINSDQDTVLRLFFYSSDFLRQGSDAEIERKDGDPEDARPPVLDAIVSVLIDCGDNIVGEIFDPASISYMRWLNSPRFAGFDDAKAVAAVEFRNVAAAKEAYSILSAISSTSPHRAFSVTIGKQTKHGSLQDIVKDTGNCYYAFCVDEETLIGTYGPPSSCVKVVKTCMRKDAGDFYRAQATAGAIAVSAEFFHRKRYALYGEGESRRIGRMNFRYVVPEFQTFYCAAEFHHLKFAGTRRARKLVRRHRQLCGWRPVDDYVRTLAEHVRGCRDEKDLDALLATRERLARAIDDATKAANATDSRPKKSKRKAARQINRFKDRLRDANDAIEYACYALNLSDAKDGATKTTVESTRKTAEGMRLRMFVNRTSRDSARYIQRYWEKRGGNWLTDAYLDVLYASGLHVVTVELYLEERCDAGASKFHLVAGEIGYVLGRTFTSLTGWSLKNDLEGRQAGMEMWGRDPLFEHLGTIQLLCLGKWLQRSGFVIWSLGHPPRKTRKEVKKESDAAASKAADEGGSSTSADTGAASKQFVTKFEMRYKYDMGARVYRRPDFLEAWRIFSQRPSPSSTEASFMRDGEEFPYWDEVF